MLETFCLVPDADAENLKRFKFAIFSGLSDISLPCSEIRLARKNIRNRNPLAFKPKVEN